MDLTNMVAKLRLQSEQIAEAILSLERLARGRGKRRGRPPGSKNKHEPSQMLEKAEEVVRVRPVASPQEGS